MDGKIRYEFVGEAWQHSSSGGWHFVSVPTTIAREIRENLGWQEEGWGRLKATARIGDTEWETAIWYDTKHKTYLLPLKSEIRKKENIVAGNKVEPTIWI